MQQTGTNILKIIKNRKVIIMKKILCLLTAVLMLVLITGCNYKPEPTEVTTEQETNTEIETQTEVYTETETEVYTETDTYVPDYKYEIKTVIYEDYKNSKGSIKFEFSKPIFEDDSMLSEKINEVYNKIEAEYKSEIKKIKEDYIPLPDNKKYPWYYTEISEVTYEKKGIVSFILITDWYMGGVYNSMKYGNTFDFNSGSELKINDILYGNESEIKATLENEFYKWYLDTHGFEFDPEIEGNYVTEQSGLDANFFLAEDGVHIFYEPYTVSATQGGIDILIPWTNTDLIKDFY